MINPNVSSLEKYDLKIWATKDKRSVNNFINVAIEKYIAELQRSN